MKKRTFNLSQSYDETFSNHLDNRPLIRKDGRAKYSAQPRNSQGKFTTRKDLDNKERSESANSKEKSYNDIPRQNNHCDKKEKDSRSKEGSDSVMNDYKQMIKEEQSDI